jgi:membrane-bound ClpP family serine protease
VDVVAEAEFLDKGTKVQIIEIHGNRVVVKAVKEQS